MRDANGHNLTFERLQQTNKLRCEKAFGREVKDWNAEQWACAIAGEAGELCNIVKKVFRGDFALNEVRGEILEEIADIITYCDLMMTFLDADTGTEVAKKFNKVSARRGSGIALHSYGEGA